MTRRRHVQGNANGICTYCIAGLLRLNPLTHSRTCNLTQKRKQCTTRGSVGFVRAKNNPICRQYAPQPSYQSMPLQKIYSLNIVSENYENASLKSKRNSSHIPCHLLWQSKVASFSASLMMKNSNKNLSVCIGIKTM